MSGRTASFPIWCLSSSLSQDGPWNKLRKEIYMERAPKGELGDLSCRPGLVILGSHFLSLNLSFLSVKWGCQIKDSLRSLPSLNILWSSHPSWDSPDAKCSFRWLWSWRDPGLAEEVRFHCPPSSLTLPRRPLIKWFDPTPPSKKKDAKSKT